MLAGDELFNDDIEDLVILTVIDELENEPNEG